MRHSPTIGGNGGSWQLNNSNVFLSLIVCYNRKRSALLSNNSLFVGQLYEDKSLALRARDLIFFTTDLQTLNYNSTIRCETWSITLIYYSAVPL